MASKAAETIVSREAEACGGSVNREQALARYCRRMS